MNKYLVLFLILFFIVAIAIGLSAIFEDVRPQSNASNSCPVQEFPEDAVCPEGTRMELVKDSTGCFVFGCN